MLYRIPLQYIRHIRVAKQPCKRFFQVSTWHCGEDKREGNPYYDKYSEKIETAKKFGKSLKHVVSNENVKKEVDWWKYNMSLVERNLEKNEKSSNKHGTKLLQNLSDLVRIELFQDKKTAEVTDIWMKYFKTKDCVSGVIVKDTYNILMNRAKEYPMFIYPLPRANGYEFILSQFSENRCLFTSLLNYQTHGDNAPWQLCLTFYNELMSSKGIALLTSEMDLDAINILEAQYLVQLQKMFYATSESNFELVRTFKDAPPHFNHMDLIKKIEDSDVCVGPVSSPGKKE